MNANCTVCGSRLDPVWVEIGETKHTTCIEAAECAHGEVRGARYCALCRHSNPWIQPPVSTPKRRRKLQNA
jgi:hypothetical protein